MARTHVPLILFFSILFAILSIPFISVFGFMVFTLLFVEFDLILIVILFMVLLLLCAVAYMPAIYWTSRLHHISIEDDHIILHRNIRRDLKVPFDSINEVERMIGYYQYRTDADFNILFKTHYKGSFSSKLFHKELAKEVHIAICRYLDIDDKGEEIEYEVIS